MPAILNCPNVETLSQLLLGTLSVDEQTLLEQHLDMCQLFEDSDKHFDGR